MTDLIRTAQVAEPGGDMAVTRTTVPQAGPGEVRIAVHACGICHSDVPIVDGLMPGTVFPVTPGHEIAGRVDAVGEGVTGLEVGQPVAAGYIAGSCGKCEACRSGDSVNCAYGQIPGVAYPGGYADALTVPADGVSRIPDGMGFTDAAAMSCAGLSAFNALRNSDAEAGDVVAVLGVGGVGHMAVRMAATMGFVTVAVSRGGEKEELARQLGADHYIDGARQDVAEELRRLGGARAVISTTTDAETVSAAVDGLGRRGELVLVGYSEDNLSMNALQLITGTRRISGTISGTPLDREKAFAFAVQEGIHPMTEEFPLEEAGTAYRKMLSGDVRFRAVLTP